VGGFVNTCLANWQVSGWFPIQNEPPAKGSFFVSGFSVASLQATQGRKYPNLGNWVDDRKPSK
jgi:hypothetical protein